jgi:CheY-like chemotaxis protein
MSQSQHIFIVDDEAPAREMVGDYLKMHGFAVTLCDGGKSLRAAIETNVPDLVVLDLNMPEEDGLSIIRDLKGRANVPVIMLTATASPIDRVVGLRRLHRKALRITRIDGPDPLGTAAKHAGQGGSWNRSRWRQGTQGSIGSVRHQMARSRGPGAARRRGQ